MDSITYTTMQQQLLDYCFEHFPRDPEHSDRCETPWGTKTRLGLFRILQRVITEQDEVTK